jgi:hypothetical protein
MSEALIMPEPAWTLQPLRDLVDNVRESAHIRSDEEYELWSIPSYASGNPEIVRGRDIGSGKLEVQPDDVLISKINPRINRVWLTQQPVSGHTQVASPEWLVARVKPSVALHPEFLKYFLSSPAFRNWISSAASSVTGSHARAKAGQILEQFVPVPSIDEQDEILWLLDDLFSRLDAAATSIAAVRSKADQFRRSLLHAAFTGAVTHTGARRVSSTTKTRPFPPGPGWLMTSLAEHVNHKSGDSKIIKGKQSVSPGPGLVQGFSASGPDVWVKQGQYHGPGVVVSAVGARCGKTFLADGEWTAIANTHAIIPKDGLDSKYLWYVTNREEWWVKSGTAQPFVKVKDTLERPFHLPSLAEQQKIVQILEEQLSRQEASLALADEVERKVGVLRQSLLHAAFSGELTKEWREKNNG